MSIIAQLLDRARDNPRHKVALGVASLIAAWYIRRRSTRKDEAIESSSPRGGDRNVVVERDARKKKVAVNREFLLRLRSLIKIVLPGVRSKEFAVLALHTSFLVARTLTSIYVARLDGEIVKSIVDKNPQSFGWLLVKWLGVAIPATYINSMIRFLESKLSIAFRSRLVEHVYSMYMQSEIYYRIGNLDSRLPNPDQCLTEDVAQFCAELAHLYSHLSKPVLDVVLMTFQLVVLSRGRSASGKFGSGSKSGEAHLPAILAGVVVALTGVVLKLFTPPFGKLVAEEARLYGELRAVHSRVITHAEEIAFYGGHKVEESVLSKAYGALVKHMNYLYKKRIPYTMLEQFLMKYVWGACGLVMIAIPNFRGTAVGVEALKGVVRGPASPPTTATSGPAADIDPEDTVSNRTQDFITARGLLISAADAIERMMSSWKEITELAGRTSRVHDMITIFNEVKDGKYMRAETEIRERQAKEEKERLENSTGDEDGKEEKDNTNSDINIKRRAAEEARLARAKRDAAIMAGVGVIHDNADHVKLDNVPVVTPTGDVLICEPGLTFEVFPGQHLLISGPNGCGKSSLFRMLGGLWPVKGGVLTKPAKHRVYYVPQRPYLSTSSLLDQFIYPHTEEDMRAAGITEKDLEKILDVVALKHVVERFGWKTEKDWRDVLSGGEKQRVGMARVFYHKPLYAILDECTSQVSIDVEGQMYSYAKEQSINLLTVTHRPSLWQYHTHLLQFDGCGGWKFSELSLSLREEKSKLEGQLAGVPAAFNRLKQVCGALHETSVFVERGMILSSADSNDNDDSSTPASDDSAAAMFSPKRPVDPVFGVKVAAKKV